MSAVRSIQVQAGGIASPGLEAGPADATEAVVFVHGNPGSSSDWTDLLQGAGEIGRAVAIDMPGFGRAPVPAGFDHHVESYASFLQDALEQLGIERVHLVLHDFGGPFGLTWAIGHMQAFASVVLFNIGIMPGYRWHKLARRWRTPVIGELSQAWIPRWAWRRVMGASNPPTMPLAFIDKMYDDYDRTTRDTVLALYRATPDPGRTAAEMGPILAAEKRPTLVIWGAKDPYIDVSFAERQCEFFDVRELIVLPESGHWAFQDAPEAVRGPVLGFLRERLAESRSGAPVGPAA